ncbi:mitochondrial chaperone bcs1 [Colletotrichum sojae]|uniref:Mitochondrial chaperone bcs1 n=1 Tax=Colletotrichum sojae TaxID=2175907 RepID=A0A8H6JRV2_9PEZI|nr:mitochondrial chaperone bcs1 [Colletotrichum sojae]
MENNSLPYASEPAGGLAASLKPFFPGFDPAALSKKLGFEVSYLIPIVLPLAMAAFNLARSYFTASAGTGIDYVTSTAVISKKDDVHDALMAWISRQSFNTHPRHFSACSDSQVRDNYPSQLSGRNQKPLLFKPRFGTQWFWYKGWPVMLTHSNIEEQKNHGVSTVEAISLRCFHYVPSVLRELLKEAYSDYLVRDETKITIYNGSFGAHGDSYNSHWTRLMERRPRSLRTVITSPGLKESIVDDITDYLSPQTQSWYRDCGISWKRGFLFTGPPGTGKTSFSLALAGHFKLRIYTVSLASADASEESLAFLFRTLPEACIVLLEDIDAAGLTSTRATSKTVENRGKRASSEQDKISLSGLLNLLDGTASQEGRILIMTTNHAEHLDKALLRPGRVDMTVNFTLSDRFMFAAIFRNIYSKFSENPKEQTTVDGLSEEFAAKIPPAEFSPAELQGYLLHHRGNPEAAVVGAGDWVGVSRLDRTSGQDAKAIPPQKQLENADGPGEGGGKDASVEEILGGQSKKDD